MGKYYSGVFSPKNTSKYVGKVLPTYRSGWELKVFRYLDENIKVQTWASEAFSIPYYNTIDAKMHNYFPDILVQFINNNGEQCVELWEIKPKSQSIISESKSKKDLAAIEVNTCKWKAAQLWCSERNIVFRVLTENELFGVNKK